MSVYKEKGDRAKTKERCLKEVWECLYLVSKEDGGEDEEKSVEEDI